VDDIRGSSPDNESLDAAVGALASGQFSVFSRAQAVELGATARQIQHRVARGRWDSPMPTVFRIAGAGTSSRQAAMAAALWAGEGAVISHAAAGVLWQIEGIRARKVELWVPSPRNPRSELVTVHRGTRVDRADRTGLGSIPITTPIRTLIDLAGRLEDHRLLAAMESVFRRNLGTPDRLARRLVALRGSGRPGAGRLERLLSDRGDGRPLESTLEGKIWLLLSRSHLPRPARQHWVTTSGGRYRLDFAWPDRRLGLECDGWEHHGDREAFGKDRVRLSEMVSSGWRVLLVTWDIGTRDPRRVLRWVEASLALAA
jgi:very-short-patch-repair endonuclease